MLLHDRQVHCVARRHLPVTHDNSFCAFHRGPIEGQHLIGDAEQSVERWLDRVAAVYGNIAVQDLPQHFGISD